MMPIDPVIDAQVVLPRGPGYAGEWISVLLVLKRPSSYSTDVRISNITTTDPAIQLDLDLLDRQVRIRPGETYRLTMPLRAQEPKPVALHSIQLQVKELEANLETEVCLPAKVLEIRPAIGNEIAVRLDSLCTYADGTKVLLTLEHQGSTVFQDLTVNVLPEEAVCSGKRTINRPRFQLADKEEIELVVNHKELHIELLGTVDGQRPEARRTLLIPALPALSEKRFRFLEPRRLSIDRTAFVELTGDSQLPVSQLHGSHSLFGGSTYELVIHPQVSGVTDIQLRDIPGVIVVRNTEHDANTGDWKIRLDVTFQDVFRRAEVLYYDVKARGDQLSGEVPICLRPPRLKHWQVAGYLGIALTVQGVAGVTRLLREASFDLTTLFSDFDLRQDYNLFFLLSVPVAFAGIKVVDWLQYRLCS
jgi:hypothetical protein